MVGNFIRSQSSASAALRVIGDRGAGKTTYLAALARWPNAKPSSLVQSVIPVNDEAEELIRYAMDILEQGLELEPTIIPASTIELKGYTFSITLKTQITLDVSCKDYPGEFFSDLLNQTINPLLEEYMEDCLQATGILLLLDGTTYNKDSQYANALERFFIALDRTTVNLEKRRVALVLTKCEQTELWVNRNRPLFLTEKRFPQVYRTLESWQNKKNKPFSIEYFTASAFGMLGNNAPTPNFIKRPRGLNGVISVLKDSKRWRPFGLMAPIYWLCTGNRHRNLD